MEPLCSGHETYDCPEEREGPAWRAVEAAVIDALVGERGPWSVGELEREIESMRVGRSEVTDAIAHLYANGLLHIQNDLITPTRAARHMHVLLG
jgi:hypothetical protein